MFLDTDKIYADVTVFEKLNLWLIMKMIYHYIKVLGYYTITATSKEQ